jgi:DNA-binding CsgD family transcriptional regulator
LDRIGRLSERQRTYLRLVRENHSSKEIALLVNASHRAVDKQLLMANNILGLTDRFASARMLADHEAGVEMLYPANARPSVTPTFPLPSPLPTAEAAANILTWRQIALWTAIIAIATPVGLTVAGMTIVTLGLLLGF